MNTFVQDILVMAQLNVCTTTAISSSSTFMVCKQYTAVVGTILSFPKLRKYDNVIYVFLYQYTSLVQLNLRHKCSYSLN